MSLFEKRNRQYEKLVRMHVPAKLAYRIVIMTVA